MTSDYLFFLLKHQVVVERIHIYLVWWEEKKTQFQEYIQVSKLIVIEYHDTIAHIMNIYMYPTYYDKLTIF
jgi:hypothetical protein